MNPMLRISRGFSTSIIHASNGSPYLFNLHNQILTLREAIFVAQPPLGGTKATRSVDGEIDDQMHSPKKESESSASERVAFDSLDMETSTELCSKVSVSEKDFISLQEEYNKIVRVKHKVWCRSFVIPETFIGLSFQVHNGSKFILLKITAKMVGYRFGEFVPTRKVTAHKEVKKK